MSTDAICLNLFDITYRKAGNSLDVSTGPSLKRGSFVFLLSQIGLVFVNNRWKYGAECVEHYTFCVTCIYDVFTKGVFLLLAPTPLCPCPLLRFLARSLSLCPGLRVLLHCGPFCPSDDPGVVTHLGL